MAAPSGARRVSAAHAEDAGSYAAAVDEVVTRALAEDLGPEGDVTAALVPESATAHYALRARQTGVLAGRAPADATFRRLGPALALDWRLDDGALLEPGDTVLEVTGPLRPILTAERTALNFLGHLSGIATLTAQFVAAAHESNPSVAVLDTRKTTPGLRLLEKAAVRAGGGTNHRLGLSDALLVKDNHLAGLSITEAVSACPRPVARAMAWRSNATRSSRWPRRRGRGPTPCCSTTWTRPPWSRPSGWPTSTRRDPSSPRCPAG